jgi:hypothetical protein
MAVKLNNADNYEPIMVVLTEDKYPIAYNNKIQEFVEQEVYDTIENAKKENPRIEIELELYYEKEYGLFAVESGAVESGTIYSPYSQELCDESGIFS